MPSEFQYDVFLSHSSKDKAVVRPAKAEGRMQKAKILHSAFFLPTFLGVPLNRERRFLPLRFAAIEGCLVALAGILVGKQ